MDGGVLVLHLLILFFVLGLEVKKVHVNVYKYVQVYYIIKHYNFHQESDLPHCTPLS